MYHMISNKDFYIFHDLVGKVRLKIIVVLLSLCVYLVFGEIDSYDVLPPTGCPAIVGTTSQAFYVASVYCHIFIGLHIL